MKRCMSCKSSDVREVTEAVEVRVPSAPEPLVVRVAGVSAVKCGACAESVLNGADLGRAELLAGAEALARGLRDGGTFKFIRRALGMRAAELGALLDVSPETISRWENGHRAAERSVWNTLADLVADKLEGTSTTLTRLTVPKARIPKQAIRLSLGTGSMGPR
ncbi:MAG: helix-turn-helix domain-containing protein [Anaeromyxobacteraceae bacterium]